MPGSVIRRLGTRIDDAGLIHHDDEPAAWEDADRLAGRRVDRRRCYAIIPDDTGRPELCELARWSQSCSGCTNGCGEDRGMGCHECGYHGRVQRAQWLPWLPPETYRV